MPKPPLLLRRLLLLTAVLLLTGCEASLNVALTDAPVDDASQLTMQVSSVQLLASDGSIVTLDADDEGSFDLLQYRDGETRDLVSKDGDIQGSYVGIRPVLNTGDVTLVRSDGGEYPVSVLAQPDFADIDFSLDDGDSLSLVLDLDLRFSLIKSDDSSYSLRPVVRAVDSGSAALIEGTVATAIVSSASCRNGRSLGTGVAVYAYAGSSQTPTDYYNDGTILAAVQPLASAPVVYDADSDSYRYQLHFMPADSYTLALTCQADVENPAANDGLEFLDTLNVSAAASETTEADFED